MWKRITWELVSCDREPDDSRPRLNEVIDWQERRLERRAKHSRDQFSCAIAIVHHPFMLASETMQPHTSPPSKTEVTREVRFIKKHTGAGKDEQMVANCCTRVKKTPGINLGNGTDPKNWYEPATASIRKKVDRSSCEITGEWEW